MSIVHQWQIDVTQLFNTFTEINCEMLFLCAHLNIFPINITQCSTAVDISQFPAMSSLSVETSGFHLLYCEWTLTITI